MSASCQRCESKRILDAGGKSSDLNDFALSGRRLDECYVLSGCNIGGGDCYDFRLCLDCGQVQGQWPVPSLECEEEARPKHVGDPHPAVGWHGWFPTESDRGPGAVGALSGRRGLPGATLIDREEDPSPPDRPLE